MLARNRRLVPFLSVLALMMTATAAMASPPGDDRGQNDTVDVIVLLTDEQPDPRAQAREIARDHDAEVGFVYEHALRGFSAQVPEARVNGLSRDPRVRHLERDQQASIAQQETPTGVERIFADDNTEIGIDGSDDTRVDADVAVIDTGIDLDHPDLNVNVEGSVDCLNHSGGPPFSREYFCETGGGDDDNDHGTHVGGTVGALDNDLGVVGVAPGARLWAVKVLDSSGSGAISAVVAGIDYVTLNADVIEVANMSLGCACSSTAMDEAIAASVDAGVAYAVAAGNDGQDAESFSPANHPDVLTVSALADFDGEVGGVGSPTCRNDVDDTLADFSNYGTLVEIAAPGVCITSTVPGGGYDTFSGTSMASPHAAGGAALLAASGATDPDAIRTTLIGEGNLDWNDDEDPTDTHEPLLDVSDGTVFNPATVAGSDDGVGGETNSAPTADFTHSCTDLACDFTDQSTDADGTVAGWAWDFGDGGTSTAAGPSHIYDADGTYTVSLTVTDDDGATDTTSQSVTVSDGDDATTGFTLEAEGYKVRGLHKADLSWVGADSTDVDVHRDGSVIATTDNDGAYTDHIDSRGGATYTYKVCEAGTDTCSNEATVTF